MQRADYDRYAQAFNDRDYDTVYDFYADGAAIRFFGVDLGSRAAFKHFYAFLHAHVIETLMIERFAASDTLVALEGIIRVEGIQDLDAATLAARGLEQFAPIAKGQVQSMRQYIHYHVENGRFTSVGCAIMG